jgi:FixJ family two-component response regulator
MPMIAIVDDDEAVCQATRSLLRSLGYQVATFLAAEEFLNSGLLPETSCLITDVQMRGMTGLELQERLKADGHDMAVIVVTAFPDDGVRNRAIQ